MLEEELQSLRSAFKGRMKPERWVRDHLHPVDRLDAEDFVRDIEAGEDRALLFQSAIPYFAMLTDEARVFLLPDYLGTIAKYEHVVSDVAIELEPERSKSLLGSLTPAERAALLRFIRALAETEKMQFYLEELRELEQMVEASRK
ncbi:hypothetical protein [Pedosphaera parvula]|uniref:Uncharacterized protein n=1 Tax=Pedosphaera parvula (strain Ellin514) TaxID=320771 RepID=B9XJC9_PEDPL|nr:hypothetical protein [Pedosphaera parvula]EEF59990.1 hypothetical protein Cflav_PD3049 [Pedosphaera parvula Ellin514]